MTNADGQMSAWQVHKDSKPYSNLPCWLEASVHKNMPLFLKHKFYEKQHK